MLPIFIGKKQIIEYEIHVEEGIWLEMIAWPLNVARASFIDYLKFGFSRIYS